MSGRGLSVLCVVCALGAGALVPRSASAASPQEQALAQALFDDARRLMDAKRYAEACPKLAESQRLDPGGGTLLNLAICHEKEGKLATAKLDYEDALALAVKDSRKDRQQIARERAAALESTIPRLSVVVGPASETEGLEVKLDGLVLRRAAWGVATTVDPGAHVIEASAPNRVTWTTNIALTALQRRVVEVPPLAPLSALPPGEPSVVIAVPPAPSVEPAPSPVREDGGAPYFMAPRKANPVFYGALAVTLGGAVTSVITGALALSARSDAKSAGCLPDRQYCPDQEGSDAADRARTLAWVSTISLGVAAAGAITMMVAPSKIAGAKPALRAGVLPGGASIDLVGSF